MNLNSVNNIQIERLINELGSMYLGNKFVELNIILCSIKGLALLHQTHHWKSSGPTSYSDHLMFDRIYNTTNEGFDPVAERMVGLSGTSMIDAMKILSGAHKFIKITNDSCSSSDDYCKLSLCGEELFLYTIEVSMDSLKNQNLLSRGLEQLLGTIADKHEEIVYLLKQRCSE